MRSVHGTALLALALAGAGCTGNDATVVEGEADASAATVVVQGFAFDDASIVVAPDAVITWDNQDDVAHTVTSGTPNEPTQAFDVELAAGGEVSISVEEPGTYPYYCRIHPDMTADIVVEPAVG